MFIIVPVYKVVSSENDVYLENFSSGIVCKTLDEAWDVSCGYKEDKKPLFDETNQDCFLSSMSVYEVTVEGITFQYDVQPFWWDQKTCEERM